MSRQMKLATCKLRLFVGRGGLTRWFLSRAPELFSRPILLIFGFLERGESDFPDLLLFRSFRTTKFVSEPGLWKNVGFFSSFAWVIGELGGGLSDLGWFLFLNHSKDECQARFYGYQTPVGGTGTPLNDLWFEEVMGKKTDFGSVEFCLGGYRARGWTSRPRMIFIFWPFER